MFGDGPLLFREYVMREPVPLAIIHTAVIEFLRGKNDAVLFGAQAVNAYVDEARATQDVDVLSLRAAELAEEIRGHLNARFHIAARVWAVREGIGYRVFQLRKPKNRHLVDVRPVESLPPNQLVEQVRVVSPAELIANKVAAYHHRKGTPKAGTDWRDTAILLLTFPHLKEYEGSVQERLVAGGADEAVLSTWREIVEQEIRPQDEEEGY